ncbi:hypothetical protein JXK06_00915 [Patescibacteria group bacterium]|nr:hypothetical protein [Patescibacteria group bacterium]
MNIIKEALSSTDSGEDDYRQGPRPVILLLLDGFGVAPANEGNAFSQIKTPTINKLINDYPVALLSSLSGSVNQRYLNLGTANDADEINIEAKREFLSLSALISNKNLKQIKITESERFAALTNFFNGLKEDKLPLEDWKIISSTLKNGKTLGRGLLTKKIFSELLNRLDDDIPADLIVVSAPGIDLTARTGEMKAVHEEIILVDRLLKKLTDKVLEKNACLLISSVFGNAEKMLDLSMEINDNNPTQNPLPLIFISSDFKGLKVGKTDVMNSDLSSLIVSGSLIDIAPTILKIMNLERPVSMKGKNLAENLL